MDQNPADFSVQKEAYLKELLDLMIHSLEAGTLTADDSEKASRFIADGFDKAQSIYYIKALIEQLCAEWPVFTPALTSFEKQEAQSEDQEKIQEAHEQLEELQKGTVNNG